MIISFAHTTPALLAGRKTVTRRDWKPEHAAKFKPGMICDAWNYSPRVVKRNPHKVAEIEIVSVTRESTKDMPDSDYAAEGFGYLDEIEGGRYWVCFFSRWIRFPETLYVVRFKVVKYLEGPKAPKKETRV